MKGLKKLVMVAVTLTMCTSAFALAACDKEEQEQHEHEYIWTVTTPPECEQDGEQTGVCKICGDSITEPVEATGHDYAWTVTKPADCETDGEESGECTVCHDKTVRPISALGHKYGDWYVTTPTVNSKGSAYRECATDNEHKNTVELPELPETGNGGYKSVTPVQGSNYAKEFVYDAGELGEITFVGYVYDTSAVSNAVQLAAETNNNVIKNISQVTATNPSSGATSESVISLEYGDGYVHIEDESQNQEMWYEKQPDGSIFAALKFVDRLDNEAIKRDERSDAAKMFNGYGYYFVWDDSNHYDYGPGNFILYYYQKGQNNANGDFTEGVKVVEGKTVYWFEYSVYDDTYYSQTAGGDHLNVIRFEFSLDNNGVVDSLTATNTTYSNQKALTATDAGGNPVEVAAETNFVQNDDGYWRLVDDAKPANIQTWEITQRSSLNFGEELPETPYHYEDMLADSFDLVRVNVDGDFMPTTELGEIGEEITVNPTQAIYVHLKNVEPETANFYIDDVKVYWRTVDEDGKNVDKLLTANYANGSDWNIQYSFDPVTNVLVLNSYVAGDHTIVVKTHNVEKIFTLHVPFINPTGLTGNVYQFDEEDQLGRWDYLTKYFRIYEGQELKFTTMVDHPAYQNSDYTATVTGPDGNPVELGTGYAEGVEVSVFKTYTTGLYTVTLNSVQGSSSSTFQIKVVAAPDEDKLLSGVLVGKDSNKEDVSVTFDTEAKTAQVVIAGGTTYNLTYSYTPATQSENARLTVDYASSETKRDYEFSFEVTSGYEVFVSYVNEFGESQRVYVSSNVKNNITGTFSLVPSGNAKQTIHTVNIAGNYAIKGEATFYYELNGEMYKAPGSESLTAVNNIILPLEEGDVLKIWTLDASSAYTYTIELYERVQDITLSVTEAEVYVGGENLNIKVTFNPDEASFQTLRWTSSDETVATVDSNGVVTALSEGVVTITVTSRDNPEATASCELTVHYITATSISLDKQTAELTVGGTESLTLKATVGPENASNKTVNWYSSDETVATVNANGVVTLVKGLKEGTTVTIYATSVDSTPEASIIASCVITVNYIDATSVSLDKQTAELTVGGTESLTLKATVGPENASDKTVVWTSSDESVATVNERGVVTLVSGLSADTSVTITATTSKNEVTASCVITVKYIPVTELSLDKSDVELSTGTLKLVATVGPENASNKGVVWSSSNTDMLAVDENGTVRIVAKVKEDSDVTITATSAADNTISASCVVHVKYIPVEEAVLNVTERTLEVGKTLQLNATLNREDQLASIQDVTWTSSNPEVVSVDENGLVTVSASYKTNGTVVTVTATSVDNPQISATCEVTVKYVAVASMAISKTTSSGTVTKTVAADNKSAEVTLSPNGTTNSTIAVYLAFKPETGVTDAVSNKNYTITSTGDDELFTILEYHTSSSDYFVLTVSKDLRAGGTATVTVVSEDNPEETVVINVTVSYVPVEGITLNVTESYLYVGGSDLTLTATVNPTDATIKNVLWSADSDIVTVTNGVVKLKDTSIRTNTDVIVTATALDNDEVTAQCLVTVVYVPVTDIQLEDVSLMLGEVTPFKVTYLPDDASIKELEVDDFESDVVSISNGVITALKAGTVTVSVYAKGDPDVKGTVNVTVKAAELTEGENVISLEKNTNNEYVVTGKPNTKYVISLPAELYSNYSCKIYDNKTIYMYAGVAKYTGTTDDNGKLTIYVTVGYYFETYFLPINVEEFVPPEGGDGSLDAPFEVKVDTPFTASVTVGSAQQYIGVITIEEDGSYDIVANSGNPKVFICSTLEEIYSGYYGYASGSALNYDSMWGTATSTNIQLSAGTYYLTIGNNDYSYFSTPGEVSFTITKS